MCDIVDAVDLDALKILRVHYKNATRVYVFFEPSDSEFYCSKANQYIYLYYIVCWFVYLMEFDATFNNFSVILWSVLLVEETEGPGEKPPTCRKSPTKCMT